MTQDQIQELKDSAYRIYLEIKNNYPTHNQVCNGVHADNGSCEGEYLFYQSVDRLEKILKDIKML